MRILVSGDSGFLGSHVADALLEAGHLVIGVDDYSGGLRNTPKNPKWHNFYRPYEVDIANFKAIEEVFACERPEIIFHAAACAREGASEMQPVKIVRTNVYITTILLELGILYGMRRFIYTSSISIYGKGKLPFDENMRPAPVDPYGVNKWASEQIIRQLCETHEKEAVILRPHNVVGPGQSLSDIKRNVAGIFINSIMRGEPLYLFGGGQCKRAFSYILDSLPCFIRACFDDKVTGETINVGGKEAITVKDLAEEIIKNMEALGYRRPEMIDLPYRPHEVTDAFCTTKKSEELLGYTETYGWREGIKQMCNWAHNLGPQPWLYDELALVNKKTPQHWIRK